jgi:hypothetical protein
MYLLNKILNFRERLDLVKRELNEDKNRMLESMTAIQNKILDQFNNEIKLRKNLEERVSNIKRLI